MTPMPPGRSRTGWGIGCGGICLEYKIKKKMRESIYKYAVLCTNCNAYIPREFLLKIKGYKKLACPCCHRVWLKGVYKQNTLRYKLNRSRVEKTLADLISKYNVLAVTPFNAYTLPPTPK